jgi:hypothetical protein
MLYRVLTWFQLSVEPLFTSAAVINTFAEAPSWTVFFRKYYWCNFIFNCNNCRFSSNISVLSVTVKVTVFAPTLEQLNDVYLKTKPSIPQLSVEPLFISATTIEAVPAALLNCDILRINCCNFIFNCYDCCFSSNVSVFICNC